jgi:hypothetical protein
LKRRGGAPHRGYAAPFTFVSPSEVLCGTHLRVRSSLTSGRPAIRAAAFFSDEYGGWIPAYSAASLIPRVRIASPNPVASASRNPAIRSKPTPGALASRDK